jgi:hypothetical protein
VRNILYVIEEEDAPQGWLKAEKTSNDDADGGPALAIERIRD